VVPPVDPNNQDTSVLIGSEDISKLDLYSEGDPRVLDLNGALNVGNRGVCEFIEVFKNDTEYLHAMITATQEKVIPAPGRHGMVYVDVVIAAHSNEAEWQKFRADHTNEAILDRIVVVKVPYNLRLSEEVKIYKKIISNSDFHAHIAPHTLEVASMCAILSRLEPTNKCDLMTKLRIYNGEEVIEKGRTKKIDITELRQETKREGMDGMSTRFIMKALDNALADNIDGRCINPISVREALVSMVREHDFSDDHRKQYLEFLQDTLHKAYLEMLEKEITKAFVFSYEEQAEALFQNYLDHAEAFVNKGKVKDRRTGEELQPDEAFLKSIEEQIAIIGSAAEGFRQDVIAYLWSSTRRGVKVEYSSYEPLKQAIEKKLMSSVRELSRIVTRATTRDREQSEKYESMVRNLLENGYCKNCVDTVLKYAANNLWKD
jgi:serine protein kinase